MERTLGQASPESHLVSSSHVERLGQTDSTAWTFNRFVHDGNGFVGIRSSLWRFAKEVLKCWTASHLTSKFSFPAKLAEKSIQTRRWAWRNASKSCTIERFWKIQTLSESLQQCSHCSSDMRKVWATCTNLRPTLKKNTVVIKVLTQAINTCHILAHETSKSWDMETCLQSSWFIREWRSWRRKITSDVSIHTKEVSSEQLRNIRRFNTNVTPLTVPLCGPPTGWSTPKRGATVLQYFLKCKNPIEIWL